MGGVEQRVTMHSVNESFFFFKRERKVAWLVGRRGCVGAGRGGERDTCVLGFPNYTAVLSLST